MGAVERVNQTFMKKLRKLNEFKDYVSEKMVKNAQLAVNISFNRAINNSPYIIKFGKNPIFQIDQKYNVLNGETNLEEPIEKREKTIENYVKKNIIKGKRKYNATFKIGDPVLLFRDTIGHKLQSKWQEGFVVMECLDNDSYVVSKDGKKYRASKIHLKKN